MTQTNQSPERLTILRKIGDCFSDVISMYGFFDREAFEDSARALVQIEVLVELLEVHDCGSTGGFDERQPCSGDLGLFERWDWLFRKYHNPEGMKFSCGIYEDICKFTDGQTLEDLKQVSRWNAE